MYAPGGGSDARAAVDIQTQTPEAGASQMLPNPGVMGSRIPLTYPHCYGGLFISL